MIKNRDRSRLDLSPETCQRVGVDIPTIVDFGRPQPDAPALQNRGTRGNQMVTSECPDLSDYLHYCATTATQQGLP